MWTYGDVNSEAEVVNVDGGVDIEDNDQMVAGVVNIALKSLCESHILKKYIESNGKGDNGIVMNENDNTGVA